MIEKYNPSLGGKNFKRKVGYAFSYGDDYVNYITYAAKIIDVLVSEKENPIKDQ